MLHGYILFDNLDDCQACIDHINSCMGLPGARGTTYAKLPKVADKNRSGKYPLKIKGEAVNFIDKRKLVKTTSHKDLYVEPVDV